MASTLEITQKINSLGNLQKVTRAMNMIASLRFRALASRQTALRLFESSLQAVVGTVVPALEKTGDPLVVGYRKVARAHVVLFTADRGLCGSHNHGAHRALDRLAQNLGAQGTEVEVTCLGTKGGNDARRKGYAVFQHVEIKELIARPLELRTLADTLLERFRKGEVQSAYLVFNRFVSTLHHETTRQQVLPFSAFARPRPNRSQPKIDPAAEAFVEEASGLVLRYCFEMALAHSSLSEQSARMLAMDSATQNAKELMNRSIKQRNRVRQAGITNELIEIISGKEAMKR